MDRLRAMQIFARVIECGGFSRAAESLGIGNATVTDSINSLEKHLGVTLIQRSTRQLRLTDEGNRFFQESSEILRHVDRAEDDVRNKLEGTEATVRVESTIAIAHALICPLLPEFVTQHPSIAVALTLINSPRKLIEFGTDVAIRVDHVDNAEMHARPVCRSKQVVCISPALAARNPLPASPRDLDPQKCLGLLTEGRYTPRPWRFSRGNTHFTLLPRGPICCNSSDALIEAAIKGVGLIHLPDAFIKSHIKSGALLAVYPQWDYDIRTFYAVTPRARYVSPKVEAFIEFLTKALRAAGDRELHGIIPVRANRRKSR